MNDQVEGTNEGTNEEKKRGRPKKNKLTKVKLRLSRKHPRDSYPLGNFNITNEVETFELDDKLMKLLDTNEYKHWVLKLDD